MEMGRGGRMNRVKNVYKIVAEIPDYGLHIAYYSADNDYEAMYKMIDKHDITKHDIKSISLSKRGKNE